MPYIIELEDELNDSFRCYYIFKRLLEETGEDYIDYNEFIIEPIPFVFWMKGCGDMSEYQLERFMSIRMKLCLQEVLSDEILFPNTYGDSLLAQIKAYTMLSEYMCQSQVFRERIWGSIHDEAYSFEDEKFYTDENGISLACIIDNGEMRPKRNFHYEDVLDMNLKDVRNLSYKTEFNLGREMSFKQADIFLKGER